MGKEVSKVETASFRGTDELYINTADGWCYVFQRPNEHEPYRFKHKRRPDGSLSKHRSRTPETVVEYMESRHDCADLHPSFQIGEERWGNE